MSAGGGVGPFVALVLCVLGLVLCVLGLVLVAVLMARLSTGAAGAASVLLFGLLASVPGVLLFVFGSRCDHD